MTLEKKKFKKEEEEEEEDKALSELCCISCSTRDYRTC